MVNTKQIKNLAEYEGIDKVISSFEFQILLEQEKSDILNLKSNIPSLDKVVDGFRNGELIIISGPTKSGKTLFCQTLTVQFAQQHEFSLWFTFEVRPREFFSKFDKIPLIYMPKILKAHALSWVEERIRESFEKYHTRVIFIDHLHYLFDLARTRNPSIEIGQVIRRLKTIAVQNDFLIFLICHTTKGSNEENLSYESIRDSSFVSQESDCVLMIRRTPKEGLNTARLRVEFHRRTGVIEEKINLIKTGHYLRELIKESNKE